MGIASYIIYSIKLSDILPSRSSPTSTLTQSQSESCSEGKGCSDSELQRVAHIEGGGDGLPFLIEHSKQPKILLACGLKMEWLEVWNTPTSDAPLWQKCHRIGIRYVSDTDTGGIPIRPYRRVSREAKKNHCFYYPGDTAWICLGYIQDTASINRIREK